MPTVSLHVAVRKQGPPVGVGVLPALIPCRFGKLAARSVNRLDGCSVTDTVVVRSDAHDGAVLAVKANVVLLEMAPPHAIKVPELGYPGGKGTGDGVQRAQRECCVQEMQ